MKIRKWDSSHKTFFAGILVALGANQVSASLTSNERSTLENRTNYDWSSDLISLDYDGSWMYLNQENATEGWSWAKIKMDRECPYLNHSDLTNVSHSASEHGLLREITGRGSQLSITEQYA